MFWGVTLESGKRYSQKVLESYHLSMACLEPLHGGTKPANKEVPVMIEHGESEYVLCVLEYGRVMQVNLDIIFDCGEVVTYFLNGEGVVHLTGYALAETEDDCIANNKSSGVQALHVEDEEEEADEDWTPSKEEPNSESSDGESEDSAEEDSDDSELSEPELVSKNGDHSDIIQLSETNEDEESDDTEEKVTKMSVKGNKAKKRKVSDSPPAENGNIRGDKEKSKKRQRVEINHVNEEDSGDEDLSGEDESEEDDTDDDDASSSVDYSSDEGQETSSAGRTPMPNKKVASNSSLGESPDLPHGQKNLSQKQQKAKLKTPDVTPTNKGSNLVTPKNAKKLLGNVQVEELKAGNGPAAKKGRFVFLHYEGKLGNGKVFETCEPPKKPFSFRLGRGEVIKGLDIGIEGLKVGGKRRITIPPNMGYGSQKNDLIPSNSTLIFTVDLKSVS